MLHGMYRGVFNGSDFDETTESMPEEPNNEAKSFYRLLKDAGKQLYPNCVKFSKLSFIMRLFQMKCMYGWSNTSLDSLLKLLSDVLPKENVLPNTYYEVQKIIKDLGLDYVKIDACVNNCILYRKEYVDLEQCPVCNEKRWTKRKGEDANDDVASSSLDKKKKGIPRKVLRYVPLIPRLQRMFMSIETAEEMRWHKNKRVDDGVLRHPADSLAWKQFDKEHSDFASDPRSVRLGLASDGFNPFGSMSNSYSMWPVILIPYNLPLWLCMKQSNLLLSLLVPGPKSPGMAIDVYLQPLIDDLKILWADGIETYDAFKKQNFQLRASLLWTINDFPAYGILSGWSTKGKLACPVCHVQTCSIYLKHGRKQCYMGHRRFLDIDHPYRRNKSCFDNTKEERLAPKALSGEVNEKVIDVVAEKLQEAEEGADLDPIVNAAFVQVMGEKSSYILGVGSRTKPKSRISTIEIQEQLRAQAEEERRKRENVEINLLKVETQLEEMKARSLEDQKMFRESIMALVSHLPNSENVVLPAAIFNVGVNSTSSDETNSRTFVNDNQLMGDLHERQNQELEMQKELDTLKNNLSCVKQNLVAAALDCDKIRSLCDETDAELQLAITEKKTIEMRHAKLSSQGVTRNMTEELIDAQNQVLKEEEKDLKSRNMLRIAEEKKKKLFREKRSLEEKIIKLEKKKSSEDEQP